MNRKQRELAALMKLQSRGTKQAVQKATKDTFLMLLAMPVYIIHNNYEDLAPEEYNGVGRPERMAELMLDLYDSVERGYVTMEDLRQVLKEEGGMELYAKEEIQKDSDRIRPKL